MRHQDAPADVFGEVLTLCAKAGLAKVGVIAVDGTKVAANASRNENLDYEQIARELVERAIATTPTRARPACAQSPSTAANRPANASAWRSTKRAIVA